jgi:hypothetical protein
MNYLLLLALGGAASLTACSGGTVDPASGEVVLMHNDFEALGEWIPDSTTLSQTRVHSGHHSLTVGPRREYSLTYRQLLGNLSPTHIRGVRVSAWIYTPGKNVTAELRVALNNAAGVSTVMDDAIKLPPTKGKWLKVSKEIVFPPSITHSYELVIYLWRGSGNETAFLDDLQLTVLP